MNNPSLQWSVSRCCALLQVGMSEEVLSQAVLQCQKPASLLRWSEMEKGDTFRIKSMRSTQFACVRSAPKKDRKIAVCRHARGSNRKTCRRHRWKNDIFLIAFSNNSALSRHANRAYQGCSDVGFNFNYNTLNEFRAWSQSLPPSTKRREKS